MRVGLVASPWVSVPPLGYGGSEVVIDGLARGLQQAGDEVVLFATGDSTCPVPRLSCYDSALGIAAANTASEARHVVHAYEALHGCDVIHDHTLVGPLYGCGLVDAPPIVATNHGPFTPELTDLFAAIGDRVAVVAISHHQRSTAPTVPVAEVIHHGIDVDEVPFGRGEGGYAVFLGRMSPDKGVHRAIRIARAAGVALVIAAKMWEPEERRYFEDEVESLLGDDAVYVGEVGGAAKYALLGSAIALLNPIRWPEPFGFVMIEALAAGTPVVAFAEGAAPEIVDHGITGFVCEHEADMVASLAQVRDLRRKDCRASVAERFSAERMVADHRRLYQRLVDRVSASAAGFIDPTGPQHSARHETSS